MIRFPPKTILIGYDLSDASRTAWKHAHALAAICGAALEAVYVEPWQPGYELMPPSGLTPAQERTLRAKIGAEIGAETRLTILTGDPARRILNLARRLRPDLIVLGTRGRKGLKRALLGSTVERVIRDSRAPVLVARGRYRPVRSVLAPVNFTPYSEYGFAYAAAAAAGLSAGLKALHVTDDPIWSGNRHRRLSALIERLPEEIRRTCRPVPESVLGRTIKGILKARKGQDWIVLVAHQKSVIGDALFGTTLEQVLRRSSIPVLSVPAPSAESAASHEGGWRLSKSS